VLLLIDRSHTFLLTIARVGFTLLLLTAAFDRTPGQQSANLALPFSRGEELVYQTEFNRGLLHGVDVAEFRFSANTSRIVPKEAAADDPVVLILVGDVASKGLFTRLAGFHFHQHVESVVDPNPFRVLRTNKVDQQNKRTRLSEAVFDHEARKVTWTERDPNQSQPLRTTVIDFSEPIQDVLTVVYFLRTQRLEVGKSLDVPVSDSGRVFRFSVAVMERKKISSVLGRVNAVRVQPAMFGDSALVRSRGTLSIWITEDSRHLPIKAQLKLDMGTFDIKLKRVNYHETTLAR